MKASWEFWVLEDRIRWKILIKSKSKFLMAVNWHAGAALSLGFTGHCSILSVISALLELRLVGRR